MIAARIEKQLMVTVENRVGALAEISGTIADEGINLIAVCAYVVDKLGFLVFVTENTKKAKKILKEHNYDVREEEVVVATIDNKLGMLKSMTEKIANAGADITLLYGSVEKKAKRCNIIVASENNEVVIAAIKGK